MNLKSVILITCVIFLTCLISPREIFSRLGVGVGTGTITIDENLKPGMIYKFPSLTVFNTGDVPSDYEVDVGYKTDQEEKRVPKKWVKFSPKSFYLSPGESQSVDIMLELPLNAEPGEYFSFLQGKPVILEEGGATIGVAAAAKLRFTIVPANVLAAVYYRALFFWRDFYPWTAIVAGVVGGGALIITLKRLLGIDINVQMGNKTKKSSKKENIKEKD